MPSGSVHSFVAATAVIVALQVHAPEAQAAEVINVFLDQAKIVEIPEAAMTIVIGNPLFVDATMLKSSAKMVLTGKGFGETNLVTLDKNGVALSDSIVRIHPGEKNLVVQRGLERESYTCNPRCQPTVALGDSSRFMGDTASQISSRNTAATAGAKPR